jgi:hypothetical protein
MGVKRSSGDLRKVLVVIVMLSLPLVYALSTGPIAMLFVNGHLPINVFRIYMTPLTAVRKVCPPVNQAMNWYLRHWVDEG